MRPAWVETTAHEWCSWCAHHIPHSTPAAWLAGTRELVCYDCGQAVETQQAVGAR